MLHWISIIEQKIAQKSKKKYVFQNVCFKLCILTLIPEH
jgi:hypothetical protein